MVLSKEKERTHMKHTSRLFVIFLTFALLLSLAVPALADRDDAQVIRLNTTQNGKNYTHSATLDGTAVPEYDYTWHADPSTAHDDVKNSPAEYYTGTKPSGKDSVYIAHDIFYFPMLEQSKFKQVKYDGATEWVYMYEIPGYQSFIFATLPNLKTGFPSHMMHTAEEAYQNAVLYITQPGTYLLEGNWHGQVNIDLREDAFDDPSQKVTLILNGVDITCTVAPGVIFSNVYECDNGWEDADTNPYNVDTSTAGANVILADGTVNNVSGTNIFRILKTQYKKDKNNVLYAEQKKRLKLDGAFYSCQSMNISGQQAGTGVLNITAGFEGLNSELHLTVNSGNVNIFSQDDGINVNENDVSVLAINGGRLHICAGLGAEGDGVDSNGYLVVNGGTVISAAHPASDAGLDSSCGTYVSGGTVVSLGATRNWAEANSHSTQAVLNLRFRQERHSDEAIIITDTKGKVLFAYDPDKDEVTGANLRTYSGAIVSAPGLTVGTTCNIYLGGTVTGTEISGVYDPATVTDFQGATAQCYDTNRTAFPLSQPVNNFSDLTNADNAGLLDVPDDFWPYVLLFALGAVLAISLVLVIQRIREKA